MQCVIFETYKWKIYFNVVLFCLSHLQSFFRSENADEKKEIFDFNFPFCLAILYWFVQQMTKINPWIIL